MNTAGSGAAENQVAETPSRLGLASWLLYDFATNSYAAIVLTFLFAPYFTQQIAPDERSGLIVPGVLILLVRTPMWFWILAVIIGVFGGPVQASSRSFLSRIAPEPLRNQMFGLYAFSGKVAFFCPLLVAGLTFLSGSLRVGMTAIIGFFTIGMLLLWTIPAGAEDNAAETSSGTE